MAENDGMRRYVEAATALTQITRARAEELVRELIKTGEFERHRAQDWVEDLVKSSRERSEALVTTVRGEVRDQLKDLGITNVDDLAKKVADVMARAETAARKATHRPDGKKSKGASKKASDAKKASKPAKKAAADKTGAKKASAAKKTVAKKTAAKKTSKKAGA
jgi:polyhydroxyalkanoate synthesis regulator phasin